MQSRHTGEGRCAGELPPRSEHIGKGQEVMTWVRGMLTGCGEGADKSRHEIIGRVTKANTCRQEPEGGGG